MKKRCECLTRHGIKSSQFFFQSCPKNHWKPYGENWLVGHGTFTSFSFLFTLFCLSYVLLVSPTAPSKPQAIVNPKNSVAPVLKKKTVSGFEGHGSFNHQRSTEMRCHLSAPLDSFFRLLDFGVVDKDSAWIEKNLETLEILKKFELRSSSRALSTASSVMIVGLSVNRCSHSVNQFDERKQDLLVQKFGLRRLQRIDVIQAEPPLLFFCLLDKRKLARRLLYEWLHLSLQKFAFISVGTIVSPKKNWKQYLYKILEEKKPHLAEKLSFTDLNLKPRNVDQIQLSIYSVQSVTVFV